MNAARTMVDLDRAKYEELAAIEEYRAFSPGEQYAAVFASLVGEACGATVLDAGCCSGKGGLALAARGFDVTLCDYTDAHLDEDARVLPFALIRTLWDARALELAARAKGHPGRTRFQYVFCCDVLEHIPKEFTMLVVQNLLRIVSRGAFFSIALVPDVFGTWIGRALHETVEPFVWWRDHLREFGDVLDARDLHHTALLYVKPR